MGFGTMVAIVVLGFILYGIFSAISNISTLLAIIVLFVLISACSLAGGWILTKIDRKKWEDKWGDK